MKQLYKCIALCFGCILLMGCSIDKNSNVENDEDNSYVITDTYKTMYAAELVKVRKEPDVEADIIGLFADNDEVVVTGLVEDGWYRVEYDGSVGYTSEDTLSTEKIEETPSQKPINEELQNETVNNNGKTSNDVVVPKTEDTQGNLVWVPTNGGTKYHSYSSCSNMDKPMQVTKEHAEANGYTPCKRCHS